VPFGLVRLGTAEAIFGEVVSIGSPCTEEGAAVDGRMGIGPRGPTWESFVKGSSEDAPLFDMVSR
jgi:hypothetical protein